MRIPTVYECKRSFYLPHILRYLPRLPPRRTLPLLHTCARCSPDAGCLCLSHIFSHPPPTPGASYGLASSAAQLPLLLRLLTLAVRHGDALASAGADLHPVLARVPVRCWSPLVPQLLAQLSGGDSNAGPTNEPDSTTTTTTAATSTTGTSGSGSRRGHESTATAITTTDSSISSGSSSGTGRRLVTSLLRGIAGTDPAALLYPVMVMADAAHTSQQAAVPELSALLRDLRASHPRLLSQVGMGICHR